jgi:hypothetical protein
MEEGDFCMEEWMVIEAGDRYPRRVREVMDVISCVYVNRSPRSRGH